jgi:uncharacterized membrane protein YbhN (UPF0104 family)
VIGWLEQLWDTLTAVSLPLVVLGIVFQTAQTLLVALAWRNILRSAYPAGGVRYRPILSYYAGGVGLNAILPASAGTVTMLGLFRANIEGSTVAGLVGATIVQNIFFIVISVIVYAWLFLSVAGSFDVELGWFSAHPVASVVIVVGGVLLLAVAVRVLYRRFRETWENAKDGGEILSRPRTYLTQVALVEAGSYVARMGVNATFMYAFHIPVSVENVFLIVAASSISSTVALLPGAVGAQTALASVVLKGVAPQSAISAYTVGQSLITTAWNVAFGLVLLSSTIGVEATRHLVHRRRKADDLAEVGPGDESAAAVTEGGAGEMPAPD